MIRRDAVREYVSGSLWVLPTMCVLVALVVGLMLSRVNVGPDSVLAFQGTADDARSLLIDITGTMVTVIALLLGLAVVALQLSSTQFSPRLLRNFLRDRSNQLVLGVFVGTFAYCAGGLFTVGVAGGQRSDEFPRFAVTVAIVLLFLSLGLLVFFADHLAHSLQVDHIMRVVERNTLRVIRGLPPAGQPAPTRPEWAVAVPARVSGYLQLAHPEQLLAAAVAAGVTIRVWPQVGEHVVVGGTLAWIWTAAPDQPAPNPANLAATLNAAIRIGFERTLEQDPGFGLRQLIDPACKALSPAVNDPYTAIQAIEHLAVLFAALAARPLGHQVLHGPGESVAVVIPGRSFASLLGAAVGLIRRYGAGEPTVVRALLRFLAGTLAATGEAPRRWAAIEAEARLLVADAERTVAQPADLEMVTIEAERLRHAIAARRAALSAPATDVAGPADGAV
jgi:uncharacterized membrane protein